MTDVKKRTEIPDSNTGLTLVVEAGRDNITVAKGFGGNNASIDIAVADYWLIVPEKLRAVLEKKAEEKIPSDGICYLSRDIPDTAGMNLRLLFLSLEKLGYRMSETTKAQAQRAAKEALYVGVHTPEKSAPKPGR